jgi:hypothetical protein
MPPQRKEIHLNALRAAWGIEQPKDQHRVKENRVDRRLKENRVDRGRIKAEYVLTYVLISIQEGSIPDN